jgi:cephalosporin hydroxylase
LNFDDEVAARVAANADDAPLRAAADAFMAASIAPKYSYNFSWLGRPVIQYPQDIVAFQELVWRAQPQLIIETGVAHGGSLILSASLLELLAACGGDADGAVIGIDIDIRAHNRAAIEAHPLARRITLIEGSSTAGDVVAQVRSRAAGRERVLVCLDSNHTHAHVLAELQAYAPLVTPGSWCIVYDTVIDALPKAAYPDRPWGPGDNPATAVRAFLATRDDFVVDPSIDAKTLITVAPGGFLRRVR